MSPFHTLTLRVNDKFIIDAGCCKACINKRLELYRHISPPQTTMYQQVLSYLAEETKGQKAPPKSHLHFGEVALATVMVCLRWGSYFAVLTNPDQPQWTSAYDPEVSCIGDSEMARINIEASAALAAWIDLMRLDQARFRKMVKAAIQLLPSTVPIPDPTTNYNHFRTFSAFNSENGRQYFMNAYARNFGNAWLEKRKARILAHPTRALANGIFNEHWRNGSGVENIHAGRAYTPQPLMQRRLTLEQETLLIRETVDLFVPTMHMLYNVVTKPSQESWLEQALPYAIAFKPPINWSMDEQTREAILPDAEPQ